jgi:hypothetical protein
MDFLDIMRDLLPQKDQRPEVLALQPTVWDSSCVESVSSALLSSAATILLMANIGLRI